MLNLTRSVYSNYFREPSKKQEEEEEPKEQEEASSPSPPPLLLTPLPLSDSRIDTISRLLVVNTILLVTLVVFRKWY